MLKISQFSPRGCRAHAQILSDSLQCDPQLHNFKRKDMFRHDVQLSDRQDFPRFSRNPDPKITLRRAKNTPVVSVPGTISLEPKIGFSQVQNFKGESSASFPMVLRTSKTDIGSYVNRAREGRRKIRKTR
jgi:hypothetical protein